MKEKDPKDESSQAKNNLQFSDVFNGPNKSAIDQFIVNCASVDDLNVAAMNAGNPYHHSNKENAELDLNDELQAL